MTEVVVNTDPGKKRRLPSWMERSNSVNETGNYCETNGSSLSEKKPDILDGGFQRNSIAKTQKNKPTDDVLTLSEPETVESNKAAQRKTKTSKINVAKDNSLSKYGTTKTNIEEDVGTLKKVAYGTATKTKVRKSKRQKCDEVACPPANDNVIGITVDDLVRIAEESGVSTIISLKCISAMGKESSTSGKASHSREVTAFVCWFCRYLACEGINVKHWEGVGVQGLVEWGSSHLREELGLENHIKRQVLRTSFYVNADRQRQLECLTSKEQLQTHPSISSVSSACGPHLDSGSNKTLSRCTEMPTSNHFTCHFFEAKNSESETSAANAPQTGDSAQNMLDLLLGPLLKKPKSEDYEAATSAKEHIAFSYTTIKPSTTRKEIWKNDAVLTKKKSSLRDKVAMLLD
ncbi:hypothetical protein ZIOFF_022579 [Zingiber officinale]|uniref:Uncharacterized protein n=1 Tax=Zingiber officinale TaxID=94328 RepID=A0A8J5H9U0_ZINOF|nr:hypothetical protein ZIOFF_022579 [Zingiber officinale]